MNGKLTPGGGATPLTLAGKVTLIEFAAGAPSNPFSLAILQGAALGVPAQSNAVPGVNPIPSVGPFAPRTHVYRSTAAAWQVASAAPCTAWRENQKLA